MNIDAAHDYIKRIRNPSKRGYADHYWRWLFIHHVTIGGNPKPEIDWKEANISAMAAQAVRMQLAKFI